MKQGYVNGERVIGTAESLLATALVDGWEFEDGKPIPVHSGQTDVSWDAQETVEHNGDIVVVTEKGNEFPLSKVEWKDE